MKENKFTKYILVVLILVIIAGILTFANFKGGRKIEKGVVPGTPRLVAVADDVFGQFEGNNYSQVETIDIDGTSYRLDCSGYVNAVLNEAGIINSKDENVSVDFVNEYAVPGYTKYKFDANSIDGPAIVAKEGNIAIVNRTADDTFVYYCFGSSSATKRYLSSAELNAEGFTVMYMK